MRKIISILFVSVFLFTPIFVAAQEVSTSTEAVSIPEEISLEDLIPVYLFGDENTALAISPLSKELFVWAYATNTEIAIIGFTTTNPEIARELGAGVEEVKFFGLEYDDDTDLTYANARYYNQNIGRFLSQDPWEGELTDPQSLNKYSYARNNPLRYTDPTGETFGEKLYGTFIKGPANFVKGSAYFATHFKDIAQSVGAGAARAAINLNNDPVGTIDSFNKSVESAFWSIGQMNDVETTSLGSEIGIGFMTSQSGWKLLNKVNGTAKYNAGLANRISSGHAYNKHVLGERNVFGKEYGSLFKSEAQFGDYIERVLSNPSDKFVTQGRGLYWDDRLGSIVIDNPKNPTAFRPQEGKSYFNREVGKLKGGGLDE